MSETTERPRHRFGPTVGQARTNARRLALQALYQWHLTRQSLMEIENWFLEEQDLRGADLGYFHDLLHGVAAHAGELDAQLLPLVDRSVNDIDPVELTALRIGAFELNQRQEIPYRVIIDEGLELCKRFGAEEGYRFVNGVLDRLARQLRGAEVTRP